MIVTLGVSKLSFSQLSQLGAEDFTHLSLLRIVLCECKKGRPLTEFRGICGMNEIPPDRYMYGATLSTRKWWMSIEDRTE